MNTEPELLNERLERLAMVLDEIMPNCALLVRDALELLKNQETANLYKCPNCSTWVSAENVVRCKDCGYSLFKEGVVLPGHIVCTKPFTEHWQAVKPDNWFCADGERRNDDIS